MNTLQAGLRLAAPSEVRFAGTVVSAPRFFYGSRTHAMHEAFNVRGDGGSRVEIVDNVGLAPQVPVIVGDRIAVQGELVPQTRYGPLVHWTHHDPDHHHQDGFIDLRGKRYA
ncbi:MAG: DUF3465 domain-containing protein [Candidatus Eremiobacteraeota bacterium]|nr:DUF3465 domain-containing protein [Candidatus Eremiobacteraeota bacterium]MBC5802990.1 DUF3465 domain-containing protein [Candidatus Eremiobacteraeota bacterium]MBC5823164.1 DUF3465 domain-containing protein [Candidatus Eremiobacteraeota bacterium]